MRISDWSSDVCSSDLEGRPRQPTPHRYWRHHSLEWECRRLHVRPQFPHPHEYGCGHPSLGRPTSLCSPLPLRLQQLYYCSPRLTKRSEEHTSELQSLMRISYAVFCLKKKKTTND